MTLTTPALFGKSTRKTNAKMTRPSLMQRVRAVLGVLDPPYRLIGWILYGSGVRLMECMTLRIKDLDL